MLLRGMLLRGMSGMIRRVLEQTTNWILVVIAACGIGWGMGRIGPASAQAEFATPAFSNTGSGGGLITYFHEDTTTNKTRVIVIDPASRQMAVYHVDFANGITQLKSARNLKVDLQLQSYNSNDPSPIDMQKLLDRN